MYQKDLDARVDITHHLANVGVDKQKIPALDTIDLKHYAEDRSLSVCLVDHNEPDCTQDYLIPHVTRVVDHHQDKNTEYPRINHKDVRFSGSAISLILEELGKDKKWVDKLLTPKVAYLSVAPILLDSDNMNKDLKSTKWGNVDEKALKLIQDKSDNIIPSNYFDDLYFQKTDTKINLNLGFSLLQRKDYKNYKIAGKTWGISVIFMDLETINKEFGSETFKKELHKIVEEKQLDMYAIMTQFKTPNSTRIGRQLCIYSPKRSNLFLMQDLFENTDKIKLDPLQVGKISKLEYVYCYTNDSQEFSRKKFEPVIRDYFK